MIAGRTVLFALARLRVGSVLQPRLPDRNRNLSLVVMACKLSTHRVTQNIELVTQGTEASRSFRGDQNRPLLVILSWLLSKRKHVMKFANLYMEQGFDVATVSITPWQLMWPLKGSRLVAQDLLNFLMQVEDYQQIMLHGFSVGGYMWGEVLDIIDVNRPKYDCIIDRIVGQVWDSAADISELTIGTPRAVFPNNVILQKMLEKYLEYHMKTFYNQSTQYYIRSSQLFHSNLVRTPALFFMSNTDPVGSVTSNMRVRDQWSLLGVKTFVKIFDKSPHVGHFRKYPKEYLGELYTFLGSLQLIQNAEKVRARL